MKQHTFSSQLNKLFFMNISAFAIIFFLLSFITTNLIEKTAYEQVDTALFEMKDQPTLINFELNQSKLESEFSSAPKNKPLPFKPNNNSFNTQIILWNKDRQIVNSSSFKNRLSDLESLTLDDEQLNKIQTLSLKSTDNPNELLFRSLTFSAYDNNDDIMYIQIISNVNQIYESIKQTKMIITLSMLFFWLLSIVISYYLARYNIRPILKSWKKQQEFVANASHEIRTPLAIISLNLEKLFTKPSSSIIDESEAIAEALSETKRLSRLTTDLLLLAKSDSNSLILDLKSIKTKPFIENMIKPFQVIANNQNKKMILEKNDSFEATIDQEKIHQVLVILIDNALKYTKQYQYIKFSSYKDKKNWVIKIENNGSSIQENHLEKIFQRFYQNPSATINSKNSNGLGLSIAKQIVEEHHGKISVTNIEPTGVLFSISLPIHSTQK